MIGPDGSRMSLAEHAVLRVAGWPLEAAAGFAAPQLRVDAVRSVHEASDLNARCASLAESLATAIPLAGAGTRRWLLAARRALHGGHVVPAPPADPIGDEGLADLVTEALVLSDRLAASGDERDRVRREHDRLYAGQLEQLRVEAADDRFLKALAVDKPPVADQWRRTLERPGPERARVRRLHATVFRYLMGAAGRATPRQAWAGVVPVVPDDRPGLRVTTASPAYRFTPAVEPFAHVLHRWFEMSATSPSWPLRRAPLIIEEADQWVHPTTGDLGSSWRRTEHSPARRALLDFWADGAARPPAALLEFAEEASGSGGRQRLLAAISELVAAGVLVNGAAVPTAVADCWDALNSVTPLLPEPAKGAWAPTVEAVRVGCGELDRDFDAADLDQVIAKRAMIVATVSALWSEAGLAGSPPEPVVHVDMIGPWRAAWGGDTRARRADDVAAWLSRTAAAGGAAEQFRRAIVAGLPETARHPGGTPFAEVCAAMPALQPGRASNLRDAFIGRGCDPGPLEGYWERELADHHAKRSFELAPLATCPSTRLAGPAGSMLFTLGERPWARWGRPQPGLFSARHLSLLELETGPGPTAEHLHLLERLQAVQVWGTDPARRSTAMRPVAAARMTPDGWSDESGVAVIIEIDGCDAIWLRNGPDGERRRPQYDAPAAIGLHDRASRLLLAAAMSHGWELTAWGVPLLTAEVREWHHLPRLSLPGGPVISAERWLVPDDVVRRLARMDPADRYIEWCGELARRALPSLALVRRGLDPSGPEMLFPLDSPLAVAAVFEPLADVGGPLVLTEVVPETCLVLGPERSARHYVAELAVTWVSDDP